MEETPEENDGVRKRPRVIRMPGDSLWRVRRYYLHVLCCPLCVGPMLTAFPGVSYVQPNGDYEEIIPAASIYRAPTATLTPRYYRQIVGLPTVEHEQNATTARYCRGADSIGSCQCGGGPSK